MATKVVPVRSVWQGWVGIRDRRYVTGPTGSLTTKSNLLLVLKLRGKPVETMFISLAEIESRTVGMSEHPMPDRFSPHPDYLRYFVWKPDPVKQGVLI